MFPPDVFLDIGADVHGGVATAPRALIDDAHMLGLKWREDWRHDRTWGGGKNISTAAAEDIEIQQTIEAGMYLSIVDAAIAL